MVEKIATKISCLLSRELEDDKEEIYSYGLIIILGTILKLISIFVISYITNSVMTTFIVAVFFIIFRRTIGGKHCNTYKQCFIISIILVPSLGLLGKIIKFNQGHLLFLVIFIYIISMVINILYVPKIEKRRMIAHSAKKRIKIKVAILLTIWLVIYIMLNNYTVSAHVLSSALGITSAFILVTPIGYKVINYII